MVAPGTYRVSATWTADPSRATNAPFSVYQGGNLAGSFAVDQQDAPSTFTDAGTSWRDLGGLYLDYRVSGHVVITITRKGGANAVLSGLFLGWASCGACRPPARPRQ